MGMGSDCHYIINNKELIPNYINNILILNYPHSEWNGGIASSRRRWGYVKGKYINNDDKINKKVNAFPYAKSVWGVSISIYIRVPIPISFADGGGVICFINKNIIKSITLIMNSIYIYWRLYPSNRAPIPHPLRGWWGGRCYIKIGRRGIPSRPHTQRVWDISLGKTLYIIN